MGIFIEKAGQRIELRGWIGPQTPARCKSVAGARFSKDPDPHWRYPLELVTCRALRIAFPELEIGSELDAWARAALLDEGKLATLASQSDAELPNVAKYAPRIAEAMANRTYQRVAAAFGATAGNFLLSDQPGLGKTIEVLGALIEAQGAETGVHLVFCPKVAVTTVWANEIAQWLGDRAVCFTLTGTRAQREATLAEAALRARSVNRDVFVIANIEMARIKPWKTPEGKLVYKVAADSYVQPVKSPLYYKPVSEKHVKTGAEYPELFAREWSTIIVDESHRALIANSGQPTQLRAGFAKLRSERRIALSGTPMRGKPHQLWGTLNWLRPDMFGSKWRWIEQYFDISSNRFSSYVIGDLKPDALDRMGRDLQNYSLRRTKAEVLPELPAKSYAGTYLIPGDPDSPHGVWLDLAPAQAKMYAALVKEGSVDFADGSSLIANGILAQGTRCKQLAGASGTMVGEHFTPTLPSPKFDWLVEKLDELGIGPEGEGSAKIVVASQFTQLLNLFAKELRNLGYSLHLLTGETSEKARQAMVLDFQSETSTTRIFLLNTKAGGVAITLDAADDLVMLDETYIPDDQEQVEDRIHRTSRMHNVTIHYLRSLDTIEEEIAWVTAARESVQKYLLDGVRGVEQAKSIYLAKAAA